MSYSNEDRQNEIGLNDNQRLWLGERNRSGAEPYFRGEKASRYVSFVLKARPTKGQSQEPRFSAETRFVDANELDVISVASVPQAPKKFYIQCQVASLFYDKHAESVRVGGYARRSVFAEYNVSEMPSQQSPEFTEEVISGGVAALRGGHFSAVESELWIDICLDDVVQYRISQRYREQLRFNVTEGMLVRPGAVLVSFYDNVPYGQAKLATNGAPVWSKVGQRLLPASRPISTAVLKAWQLGIMCELQDSQASADDAAFPTVLAKIPFDVHTPPRQVPFLTEFGPETYFIYHSGLVLMDVRFLTPEDLVKAVGFMVDMAPVQRHLDAETGAYLLPAIYRDDMAAESVSAAGVIWGFRARHELPDYRPTRSRSNKRGVTVDFAETS